MSKLKDRLSSLNRDFREIEVKSLDGTHTEKAYYRRPVEAEDRTLRKAMDEEFELIQKTLKEGDDSVLNSFIEVFTTAGKEAAISAIINSQSQSLRQEAVRELGEDEPTIEASQEDRDAYIERLKPLFEKVVARLREVLEAEPEDTLPQKAAELRVEVIARERAWEIYRCRLIAQCLYEKDEDSGQFELAFSADEVSNALDSDTINTLTTLILDEMRRVKNLPLK